ncbi:uncharacterized protein SPSK_08526 [Sporothrix schenckii 1099-18]|uniref:C2H2-type domain-containing protein n=1 Tax=Sporothrix schenckii 1099-18 TaxID=1397361 RepID=A0A0F2M725_SPOSC|nr:uncharacterized protein SPSK_08526 [Sporothrix schenckii 1099-18]KJR84620.1 hypothetical protein SPSK_08526 [Sporothrix schenckii 1099-18]
MSSLKYILGDNEDEYHPPTHRPSSTLSSSDSHGTEGTPAHANTSTLVYRGSNNKPGKSSKPGGSSSSSSSKPSGSSSKTAHHHSSKGKSSNKGKHKAAEDDNLDVDDYDYDQSSTQLAMDSGAEYGSSAEGQYYQQSHHGHSHHGHHGSNRVGHGGYYMDPNAGAGYAHLQDTAVMHNAGVAMDGSYEAASIHQYGAMHGMDSSSMSAHGDMSGHYGGMVAYTDHRDTSYTPVTRRQSRALKGKPVHVCDRCEPRRTFTRAEHLRQVYMAQHAVSRHRHQLSHDEPRHMCTYPGCTKIFFRTDLLHRHQQKQHTWRMASNGSGSNDSTDWRSSSGEEMPQDADDGEAGPSGRQGSSQASDSPGGSWAATGAVRSTTYFSLSKGTPGSRSDNNHDSSTDPDMSETPAGRRRRRRPSSVGRGDPQGHSGVGRKRTIRSEGKTKTKNQDDNPRPSDSQTLGGQSNSLQTVRTTDLSTHDKKGKDTKGGESGRDRKTRAVRRAQGVGLHSVLVGSAASSAHQLTFHEETAPETHPMSTISPPAGDLRPRDEAQDNPYAQPRYPGPYMHTQSLQTHAGIYSRHNRNHTQSVPGIGWPPSSSSVADDNASHSGTTGPMPLPRTGMAGSSTIPIDDTEGIGHPLPVSYSMASGGFAVSANSNGPGPLLPSAHGYDPMPTHYEHPVNPPAGPAVSFASESAPPLMDSSLPRDYMSPSSSSSLRHIDAASSSGSWTTSYTLSSSVSSSARHGCTTMDDL